MAASVTTVDKKVFDRADDEGRDNDEGGDGDYDGDLMVDVVVVLAAVMVIDWGGDRAVFN